MNQQKQLKVVNPTSFNSFQHGLIPVKIKKKNTLNHNTPQTILENTPHTETSEIIIF